MLSIDIISFSKDTKVIVTESYQTGCMSMADFIYSLNNLDTVGHEKFTGNRHAIQQ